MLLLRRRRVRTATARALFFLFLFLFLFLSCARRRNSPRRAWRRSPETRRARTRRRTPQRMPQSRGGDIPLARLLACSLPVVHAPHRSTPSPPSRHHLCRKATSTPPAAVSSPMPTTSSPSPLPASAAPAATPPSPATMWARADACRCASTSRQPHGCQTTCRSCRAWRRGHEQQHSPAPLAATNARCTAPRRRARDMPNPTTTPDPQGRHRT